ncbi:unnamed protein product [Chilo suppressalis]|uniref:Uncharacterized protein n=1 Tax=Chilo suppressalis TaxID=168631 RepID=A0ABN8AYP3_CHISP|nr:unnamed protein product [Chilo suppressalis]
MADIEMKRKADDYSVVPAKKTRHEISVVGTREKAVVTSSVPRTSNLYAPIMLLEGHQGEIFTAKFHPEGKHLASAGFDRQIFMWNVYGQCENVMVMSGHTGAIMELCFSPDGSHLYTCATDNTVAVWDVPTGMRIKKLKGHTNFVNSVSGARRGPELLVSGSDDNTIKLWDARKRNPIASLDSSYPVTSVLFNDTAEKIISAGIDNVIKVWDIRNNQISYKIKGHTDTVTGVSLSWDGSYLVSNSMDGTVRIWECVRSSSVYMYHVEYASGVSLSWDGSYLVSNSMDGTVRIWECVRSSSVYMYHVEYASGVSLSWDGSYLVSNSMDGTVRIWECVRSSSVYMYHVEYASGVSLSWDGSYLVSNSMDGTVRIWECVRSSSVYMYHVEYASGVSLSWDGSYLVSNSMDGTVRIWDVRPFAPSERCVKLMSGHSHNFEKNLLRCAWAHDGAKVAAGSADRFVYIWDTTSRRVLYKLPGHNGSVNAVDFHPREPIVLSASSDKQIYLGEIDH